MRAGKYRHRITRQALPDAVDQADDYGQPADTWQSFETVWAEVFSLAGRETRLAEQIKAVASHRVRCRYLATLTTRDRFAWDETYLQILSISPDPKRRYLEVICQEMQADAG